MSFNLLIYAGVLRAAWMTSMELELQSKWNHWWGMQKNVTKAVKHSRQK